MSATTLTLAAPIRRRPRQQPDLIAWARRWLTEARQRRLLAAMDDHTLADIGAARTEAVWEDSRPVWQRIDTLR